MSLQIIKAGVLDTIQDMGRYGYQHLGVNPGGVMDRFAAQVANLLVANPAHEAVIEIHFPSSIFLFQQEVMIAISGADFSPTINGEDVPLYQPIILAKNSVLQFQKWKQGARCYLAVKELFDIPVWLKSYSTNLKAACGGFQGRALQKDDLISLRGKSNYQFVLHNAEFFVLPWRADISWTEVASTSIAFIPGNEWNHLTEESKASLLESAFTIGTLADRMGYRLQTNLAATVNHEMVSAVVGFGTIQLLPNGELIILMADHQTAGGYPRLGYIAATFLPMVAQMQPGDKIRFRVTDSAQSEGLIHQQHQHLLQLQNACTFKLEEFLSLRNERS